MMNNNKKSRKGKQKKTEREREREGRDWKEEVEIRKVNLVLRVTVDRPSSNKEPSVN